MKDQLPGGVRRAFVPSLLIASLAGCASPPQRPPGFVPRFETSSFAHEPGRIEVAITGIPTTEGQIFVELYDARTFFHYDQVLTEKVVAVTGHEMKVALEHVIPGRYIIAVSHDPNSNNKLDTGFLGFPKEAYGFSRGARGTFGPPGFEAGAFDFPGGLVTETVAVR
jgi:uncharacterized protein (DUF2141 family)